MGSLKIYIPQIALEEERTAQLEKHVESVEKMKLTFDKLQRGMLGMLVEGLPAPHLELWDMDEVARNSQATFNQFVVANKIEVIAISLEHAAGAWARETLINGVREWNREPSCSRFPHRGKEVPIEHVFRRFRVVPGALCALRTECFQGWPATVSWRAPDWRDRTS
ncbi:hypothetical protein MAFF301524_32710 [Ralstonia pseudosolanacearum]|nr:hypothetical protein MAFF301524_32710 [Ralstonia pseudosolanacearum]